MRYANPHPPYQPPQLSTQMNPMNPIQQQQLQLLQLQQQLAQQQNPMQQVQLQQQQTNLILQLVQQNPRAMAMLQANPSLLSNPQFQQQILTEAQMARAQQAQINPQAQLALLQMQQAQQAQQDNRFGAGATVQQGLLAPHPAQQEQIQAEGYTGRFPSQQPQAQQPTVTAQPVQVPPVNPNKIPVFTVVVEPLHFYNNNRITLTPHQGKFTEKLIEVDANIVSSDGMEPVFDHVVDMSRKGDDARSLFMVNAVVRDTTIRLVRTEQLDKLFAGDARQLYKTLKAVYADASGVDTLILADRLNKNLTGLVNQFLKVNLDNVVSIDSFAEDYNDLLKLLRNKFEDAEDDLVDYLLGEIEKVRALQATLEPKTSYSLVENVSVVYYANHHYLLGLKDVDSVVKLVPEKTNQFLIDMAKFVKIAGQCDKFYVLTYDRRLFLFSLNAADEVFIELIDNF